MSKYYEAEDVINLLATEYYTLINKYAGRELETDICNECMHKLIDFVKRRGVE